MCWRRSLENETILTLFNYAPGSKRRSTLSFLGNSMLILKQSCARRALSLLSVSEFALNSYHVRAGSNVIIFCVMVTKMPIVCIK